MLAEFVHFNNQFPVVSLNYFNKNAYVERLIVGAISILYTSVNKSGEVEQVFNNHLFDTCAKPSKGKVAQRLSVSPTSSSATDHKIELGTCYSRSELLYMKD